DLDGPQPRVRGCNEDYQLICRVSEIDKIVYAVSTDERDGVLHVEQLRFVFLRQQLFAFERLVKFVHIAQSRERSSRAAKAPRDAVLQMSHIKSRTAVIAVVVTVRNLAVVPRRNQVTG